jgi:hypothetical protein
MFQITKLFLRHHIPHSLVQWCDVKIQHGVSNSNIKQNKLSNKEGKYCISIKHTTEIVRSFNNTTEFNNLLDRYFSLPTFIVPRHPEINFFKLQAHDEEYLK